MVVEDINTLKLEIRKLKDELHQKEQLLQKLQLKQQKNCIYSEGLSSEEVIRYSRQMIMPQISLTGQINLKNSKVLIVGAGGLGCPASLYLVSAGVGEITILDYDEVELSNLHRQILHYESDIGVSKVRSAYDKLISINRNVKIIPIKMQANSNTIKELIRDKKFDVVVDGSDNVATRYLLNDFCVLNNIPLVSGSALQLEGQLTVYHYKNGPCYRCIFPVPPPANTVVNCGDGGVLGPVPGLIGVMQALETIKIITRAPEVISGRLLLFDGSSTTFRNIKLRKRSPKCHVCGDTPTVTELIDYEQFCGAGAHDKIINIDILPPNKQFNVEDFSKMVKNDNLVIDVRPELEYQMCKLLKTINIPYSKIMKDEGFNELMHLIQNKNDGQLKIYFLCRRGNDSQRTVIYLSEKCSNLPLTFLNVKGGLQAYSKVVDSDFPIY